MSAEVKEKPGPIPIKGDLQRMRRILTNAIAQAQCALKELDEYTKSQQFKN